MSRRPRRGGQDTGQAAVELALVLPLLAAALAGLVQIGLIARDQVLLVHAVREAARQVSVAEGAPASNPNPNPNPASGPGAGPAAAPAGPAADSAADTAVARRAALAATGGLLRPELLKIDVERHGDRVGVRAGYRAPVNLPIVNLAARYVPLAAYAEMEVENN